MKNQGSEGGGMRNLDELQEMDNGPRSSRLGALVLASLGGACIVFASVLLLKSPNKHDGATVDPLGALVAKSKSASTPSDSVGLEVTFPRLLSDGAKPTTALEAVRDLKGAAPEDADFKLPPGHPTSPPIAGDRLPVIPLPAQEILAAAGKETVASPQDVLSTMARQVSRDTGTEVETGGPGGFQLQVSSFTEVADAQAFAAALRRRGHKAYVEPAYVKGRGLWQRVRIGPFKYKRSAETYRQEFEAKERLVTFIVSPPKTKVRVAEANTGDDQ
jgi:DedD protein